MNIIIAQSVVVGQVHATDDASLGHIARGNQFSIEVRGGRMVVSRVSCVSSILYD